MARVRQQAAEDVRNANRALALEREFLACVLAKAPIGISIANESGGEFLALNERAIELIGEHTARSHSGRVIHGAVHPDGRPYAPHESPTFRAARGGTIEREQIICLRGESASSERIVLEIDAVPIRGGNGSLVGAVTVFEDAGVRERAGEELRQRVAKKLRKRFGVKTRRSSCLQVVAQKKMLPPPLDEAPFLQKPYRESELIAQIRTLTLMTNAQHL